MASILAGEAAISDRQAREYGSVATLGVAVPQANPTVEPEFWSLLPDGVSMLTTRLRGSTTDSRKRLVDYLDNFQDSLDAYDTASLDAVGFACTGTSYLIGQTEETRRIASFADAAGFPIITAAQAIRLSLEEIGAQRIALFAPYPPWLVAASYSYWEKCGLTLVSRGTVARDTSDTRKVYEVGTAEIIAGVALLDVTAADAIVLTGTGAPTLRAMSVISERTGKPVLSSNLCLAWALLKQTGGLAQTARDKSEDWLISGWRT